MSVAKVFRPISVMSTERFEPTISPARCRNLFGPIDHEQLREELQVELRRIVEEKERRWNFDFVNQKPLTGNFMWQRIGDNRTVGFSTETSSVGVLNAAVVTTRSTTTHAASSNDGTTQSSNSKANGMKTPERVTTKPQRRSLRITDYLRAKKKSTASRQIKWGDRHSIKHVRTSRSHHRGQTVKQSTLDELLPKLRPRHGNKKTSS